MYHTVAQNKADRKIVHSEEKLNGLSLSVVDKRFFIIGSRIIPKLVFIADFLCMSLISPGGNCIERGNGMKRGAAKLRWAGENAQRFVLRTN